MATPTRPAAPFDDIRKDDSPHDYTWLLQTDAQNTVELAPTGATIRPQPTSGGASPRMLLYIDAAAQIRSVVGEYE